MLLHTVNRCGDALTSCLRTLSPGDCLLLIEDAVYAACPGHVQLEALRACPAEIVVLAEDAAARGVDDRIGTEFARRDYPGFVQLAAESRAVRSWY